MSDKPEKIWISNKSLEDISALMGYHNDLCADVSAVMVPDRVEYIRADLAKPSEWISAINKIHAKVRKLEWKSKGHHCDAGKACQAIADIIKALPSPPDKEKK